MGEVRNICLVGHSGAGKTRLAESLLKLGGAEISLDSSPEAKARGYSVDLNLAYLSLNGKLLNLLDTPGFLEFIEEVYKGLGVAETALLVINAEKGVEVQTEKAWELIEEFGRAALCFVNRMDLENADFSKALAELRAKFGERFAPLQLPIREGGKLVGVVDLLERRAIHFDKRKGEIPAALGPEVEREREALLERIAEADDELMMQFLEGQEIEPARLQAALTEAVRRRLLFPVLCGSAALGLGVDLLAQQLMTITPSFSFEGVPGPAALVFNLAADPYLGRLAFAKVYGSPLSEGLALTNLSQGKKDRVKDILRARGGATEKIGQAEPGELVALTKLDGPAIGDTLAADDKVGKLKLADFPKPVFARALLPASQADEEKMSTALKELVDTKATLNVYRDEVTKEMIIWGMGETHLAVFAERLKNRYGVSLKMERPLIPYKETVQKVAEGNYKHKKQTGGRGQYGEVYLRVEPLPRGSGFEFVDEVKGGVIPNQFIPAVEKGVVEALEKGAFGYPVTDVRVAVYFGSAHPVDSSELAFKLAASKAFQIAAENASPVLLEPVMRVTVWTPSDFTGDIMSSLNGKRARILGMQPEGGRDRIEAEAPLAEVQGYVLELKSLTQGQATLQMEFQGYQPVTSAKLAEELLKRERRGTS
ncbi:MAG: elongation factor G [Candidatus Acetothermia bacterium]|jgi:elongation factor G|nr:elongation factor G [Candidatus Acetothermia bacterium]MDH7504879.1 elongation factor G [Candidatus Acetothermia bacterium]